MNTVPGDWEIDVKLNKNISGMTVEQMSLFKAAFQYFSGAEYTPLLYVGRQLVVGVQHTYIAECQLLATYPVEPTLVKVIINIMPDNYISVSHISAI